MMTGKERKIKVRIIIFDHYLYSTCLRYVYCTWYQVAQQDEKYILPKTSAIYPVVQYNQDRMLSELGSNPSNLHTSEARGIMINRVGSTRYRYTDSNNVHWTV